MRGAAVSGRDVSSQMECIPAMGLLRQENAAKEDMPALAHSWGGRAHAFTRRPGSSPICLNSTWAANRACRDKSRAISVYSSPSQMHALATR